MKQIHIRRVEDNSIVASVEADETTFRAIVRGMEDNVISGADKKYYIDDSEFGEALVVGDGLLRAITIAILLTALVIYVLVF